MLRPGILSTLAGVTVDPTELLTVAAFASPVKKKSAAVMLAASLHGNPFTFVPVRSNGPGVFI